MLELSEGESWQSIIHIKLYPYHVTAINRAIS